MTRVFNGERTFLTPVLRPVEARALPDRRRRRERASSTGSPIRSPCCCSTSAAFSSSMRCMRAAGDLPFNPAGPVRRRARSVVQYRGQLHHQHQLAELRRRKHDVLPRADARADASELPVGRDRHRARRGADPRLCARTRCRRSAISGSISPAARSTSCCRSAIVLRAVPGLAGHAADARRLCRRDDARRRQADHRARAGRLADRDQDARHQWRRLLQRQCRASVRESDGAVATSCR